jgi:glyoxylase-like metal-dependent hydrolase (beta-lactamase superfamily II)
MGFVEASQKDWLGGRQFDVDRYLHGATLEETVATGVYCLVTGKRRDSNVYFVQSGETWVLVDTGWRGRAELIRSAAETLFGVGARPRAIVLTHVHPDHAGSASELAHMWDVTVYVHPGELPLPPSGRIIGALARVERSWMFPSGRDGLSPIDPNVGVPGLPDWQVIPTPGHTPGHLALFREGDRALIPGDAVLTVNLNSPGDALSQRHTLGGPPRFATWNWRAATGSVSELARLEPSVLAPGHGRPMAGPVLAPALRALGEQLNNPDSAGSAGSSAGHKLTEWVLNFFDYSRRAR